jgi:lysozyme family protein
MTNFESAYAHTLGFEGGYVDDPDDAGGETYCGVSRRFHPTWAGWKIIDAEKEIRDKWNSPNFQQSKRDEALANFPQALRCDDTLRELVKMFYKVNFWDRFRGDAIPDAHVALELFDTGVNMGVHRAVLFLQQSLNLLNRNGTAFDDLVEDGKIGNNTLNALREYLRTDRREYLLKLQNGMQMHHYITYCRERPSQEKYIRGWLKRVTL